MVKHWRYAVELNTEPARQSDEAAKRQPDQRVAQELKADLPQIDRFKKLARELGCDEDEAAFEVALKKVAETPTLPKHEPKKRAGKEG